MKIDVYHNAVEEVRTVAWDLKQLARALDITGQTVLSSQLLGMAEHLDLQADTIFNQIGADVGQMVKDAEANSAAIFRAVLAGSALATNDKKLAKTVIDMSPKDAKEDAKRWADESFNPRRYK